MWFLCSSCRVGHVSVRLLSRCHWGFYGCPWLRCDLFNLTLGAQGLFLFFILLNKPMFCGDFIGWVPVRFVMLQTLFWPFLSILMVGIIWTRLMSCPKIKVLYNRSYTQEKFEIKMSRMWAKNLRLTVGSYSVHKRSDFVHINDSWGTLRAVICSLT